MILERIELEGFRTYDHLALDLEPGILLFVGDNAQGKTNLLEGIHVLARGTSFRTRRAADLIRYGESTARLRGRVRRAGECVDMTMALHRRGRRAAVDGLPCRRMSEYLGHLDCVAFTSEDLRLVGGPPEVRRLFLDRLVHGVRPAYIEDLRNYRVVLRQRNALLRRLGPAGSPASRELAAWTERWVEGAMRVAWARLSLLEDYAPLAGTLHDALSEQRETLTLAYESSWVGGSSELGSIDPEALRARLEEQVERRARDELLRGQTLIGPHRDDLKISLDGRLAARHASRGQIRSIAFSLRMAEMELYKKQARGRRIVLVDDVAAELDERRARRLHDMLAWADQAFVTAVSEQDLGGLTATALFNVTSGTVNRRR